MSADTVVLGAGVAGLTAALRLAEAGQRVHVVAAGVGSTQLTGGTVDVLGYAPHRVESPARSLPEFVAAHPEHPYARLSPALVGQAVEWWKERAGASGYRYVGGLEENLLLPTAVGVARPTAVAPESMAGGDLRRADPVAVVGLRPLKDFHPFLLADNLARAPGASVAARPLLLDPPTGGEADLSGPALARAFEDAEFRKEVRRELEPQLEPGERVALPAVLGLHRAAEVWRELQEELGTPVFEVPTLPPSVPGIRLFHILTAALRRAGARVTIGTRVVGAETEGRRVRAVVAEAAARPVRHEARWFVLATGGFASGGIEMDSHGRVRETVFGLPVAGVPEDREARFSPRYLDPHPVSRAGLPVDPLLRPLGEDGEPAYENLFAAGATLAGAEPWREKSGEGISVTTGYRAAGAILEAGA